MINLQHFGKSSCDTVKLNKVFPSRLCKLYKPDRGHSVRHSLALVALLCLSSGRDPWLLLLFPACSVRVLVRLCGASVASAVLFPSCAASPRSEPLSASQRTPCHNPTPAEVLPSCVILCPCARLPALSFLSASGFRSLAASQLYPASGDLPTGPIRYRFASDDLAEVLRGCVTSVTDSNE